MRPLKLAISRLIHRSSRTCRAGRSGVLASMVLSSRDPRFLRRFAARNRLSRTKFLPIRTVPRPANWSTAFLRLPSKSSTARGTLKLTTFCRSTCRRSLKTASRRRFLAALRISVGTTVNLTIANKLKKPATVFGLNTRPGDLKAGIAIPTGESREISFSGRRCGNLLLLGPHPQSRNNRTLSPGCAVERRFHHRFAGFRAARPRFCDEPAIHPSFDTASTNGKSHPYTDPLTYAVGETIRWRVINPSASEHPMHLHGAYYRVLSFGDFESDAAIPNFNPRPRSRFPHKSATFSAKQN
jgi:hypothetical protein